MSQPSSGRQHAVTLHTLVGSRWQLTIHPEGRLCMQGLSLTPQMASRVQVLADCLGWPLMAPTVLAMASRPAPSKNKLLEVVAALQGLKLLQGELIVPKTH